MENPDKSTVTGDRLKLGMLLMLVLVMADLLMRQAGLQAGSLPDAALAKAAPNFLIVQVGDFRAEIQWNNNSKNRSEP